ncbi:hypothetical protein QTP70_012259 [Hemibagrus guttatus]|uniref:5-hydroxytryptamine receptor 7 n=1 Tax=Hemibagrus guttatus TaxID=175788 RepID=A0AAE0V4W2_9TELE|nr:hypothetical protein QTP70_012259 [Hemibagrus guttatus]
MTSYFRYLGITRPLTYPVRQNGWCMARMVLSVWLLSASITLPPLFGWAQNVNDDNQCLISQDFGYTIYSTAVAFYIPMSVMLVMYRRIYRAAKLSAAKHAISGFPRPSDRGDDDDDRNSRDDDSDCMTTAMKMHRLRGAKWNEAERKSASIFRREQKAAATLGVVLGAFTFCWLPFFVLSTLRPFVCGVRCSCVPLWIERTLLWLGYANSLINPFIYAFSNRDLRTAYRSLLACRYRNINRRLSAAGVHEALRLGPRSWHHPDHGTISVPAPSGSRHHLSTGTIQVTAPSQYRHHLGHSTILSWHHLGHGTIQVTVPTWSRFAGFGTAHTAKSTKSGLNDHGVGVLDWPANSPDLNPIENLWGIVKRKMRNKRPKNADELKATVKETWASIPPQQCHKLITSMPRPTEAVIKAKGAPTKY